MEASGMYRMVSIGVLGAVVTTVALTWYEKESIYDFYSNHCHNELSRSYGYRRSTSREEPVRAVYGSIIRFTPSSTTRLLIVRAEVETLGSRDERMLLNAVVFC